MLNAGVIIRGTKNGFKKIYASETLRDTDDIMSINYDIRLSSPSEKAIGMECYGLSFSPNGNVFTLYRAMYDGLRSMAVGFLGISLFVPFEQKIKGHAIIKLLNTLMVKYMVYAPDNKLGFKTEDWTFVNEVLTIYQHEFTRNNKIPESLLSGKKEPAYIYYDEIVLDKYFDDIYQDEYKQYREILFINRNYINTDSILLVVKSSDNLTDKIDLENPDYFFDLSEIPSTAVRVDGRSDLKGYKIKKSKNLIIEFSRLNYHAVTLSGTISELSEKTDPVISIDHVKKSVKITAPAMPPVMKVISLTITSNEGVLNKQKGIVVTCKSKLTGEEKKVNRNESIDFFGDEITHEWELAVTGGGRYVDTTETITPKDNNGSSVYIILKSRNDAAEIPHVVTNTRDSLNGSNPTKKKKVINNKTLLWLVLSGGIFFGLLFFVIIPFIKHQPPTQETINTSSNDSMYKSIMLYTDGMEIYTDTLNKLKVQTESLAKKGVENDSMNALLKKITAAYKLRNAINGKFKSEITNILKEENLSATQVSFLELIRDNDFELFNSIKNREKLSLDEIKSTLEKNIKAKIEALNQAGIPDVGNQDHISGSGQNGKGMSNVSDKNGGNNIVSPGSSDNSGGHSVGQQKRPGEMTSPDPSKEPNTPKPLSDKDFLTEIKKIKKTTHVTSLREKTLTDTQKNLLERIAGNVIKYTKIPNLKNLNLDQISKEIKKYENR